MKLAGCYKATVNESETITEAKLIRAFSSEACPGLDPGGVPVRVKKTRQNKSGAPFRCNRNGKGPSVVRGGGPGATGVGRSFGRLVGRCVKPRVERS